MRTLKRKRRREPEEDGTMAVNVIMSDDRQAMGLIFETGSGSVYELELTPEQAERMADALRAGARTVRGSQGAGVRKSRRVNGG